MITRRNAASLGILLAVISAAAGPGPASAARPPPPPPPACEISPSEPTIDAGGQVSWSATYSGFSKGRKPRYAWSFGGGNPASSASAAPTVTYGTATGSPFATSLTLTAGRTTATCNTSVTVRPLADKTPPTVSIASAPPGPYTPPTTVAITATASDNAGGSGMDRVDFYDGTTLMGSDATAPYQFSWNVSGADVGTHSWTAKAFDKAGNSSVSAPLELVVESPGGTSGVSINSTSQSMVDVGGVNTSLPPVPEAPLTGSSGYKILAINDLGMHCGDLDTRVASILPPFQVLLSQVIQRGAEPRLLTPSQAAVSYSAASNPDDPMLHLDKQKDPSGNYLYPFTGLDKAGRVFKTNFWDIAYRAYDPFYPAGILCDPQGTPQPPACFAVNPDVGLPVPNVEDLYIGPDGKVDQPGSSDGFLAAVQHAMPGITSPYRANALQLAQEHYGSKPFFVNFPFGYVANDVNWFEGAGIPFAAFDDAGRQNPYPLVRVQAKGPTGAVLASVDTVLPISGEANCQGCHAATQDGGNGAGITDLDDVMTSMDDPQGVQGLVPVGVSVEWASDLNILKLHDKKHGTTLVTGTTADFPTAGSSAFEPVVCQRCHYTPALDLAQLGPLGTENDVAGPLPGGTYTPSLANGRDQVKHSSMSNVMHGHHADVKGVDGKPLFPVMPSPTADDAKTGLPGNQADREAALAQTCYQCHPGTKTKCMRGAMADGGMVCQDCHGDMRQVGEDFSRNVPEGGGFELAADFYTNPATPRVPWANEPGCGSCHTGHATRNLAGTLGTLKNGFDRSGNADDIRLIRAYRTDDAGQPIDANGTPTVNAKPIVPEAAPATDRTRRIWFAENRVPADFNGFANPGAGNPKLYRVSTGHGGVMCEGCHGATHAEWDTDGSPLTNDNVTANQLQGHSGTLSQCSTCHVTADMAADTQEGPHGMHLVNDSRFWREAHKDMAKHENAAGGGTCAACHGADHEGTVLSRAPVERTFVVEGTARTVLAGDPVACDLCHSLTKSFAR